MMKKIALLSSITVLLTINIAIAANGHEHEKGTNDPAIKEVVKIEQTEMLDTVSLPNLSVKYELKSATQKVDWLLDRKANSIATFNAASQQGELWLLDKFGDIEHSRIFVEDKTVVVYTNGQLKTMNRLPQWSQLASIYHPKQIAKLNKTGEKVLFGKKTTVYEGVLNGLPTVIWWMPDQQIPAYVQQGKGKMQTSMTMKEMRTQTPSNWSWANPAMLIDYERIDASDLGDMESDPFVKKLLEIDGGHHH